MNLNLTAFEECFWTIPFLKQLKQNFTNVKSSSFFCIYSYDFQRLWLDSEKAENIRKLAKDFLIATGNTEFNIGEGELRDVLFVYDETNESAFYNRRKIRLEFLDYEIKRLTEIMQKDVA